MMRKKILCKLSHQCNTIQSHHYSLSLFNEYYAIESFKMQMNKITFPYKQIYINMKIKVQIKMIKTDLIICNVIDYPNIQGIIHLFSSSAMSQKSLKIDQIINTQVIAINKRKKIIDLVLSQSSSSSKLANDQQHTTKQYLKQIYKELKQDMEMEGIIELIREHDVIIRLLHKKYKQIRVIAPAKTFNMNIHAQNLFKRQMKVKIMMSQIPKKVYQPLIVIIKSLFSLISIKSHKKSIKHSNFIDKQITTPDDIQINDVIDVRINLASDNLLYFKVAMCSNHSAYYGQVYGKIYAIDLYDLLIDNQYPIQNYIQNVNPNLSSILVKARVINIKESIKKEQLKLKQTETDDDDDDDQRPVVYKYNFDFSLRNAKAIESLTIGQEIKAIVTNIHSNEDDQHILYVQCANSYTGRIFINKNQIKSYNTGQCITCYIKYINLIYKKLDLSLTRTIVNEEIHLGQQYSGKIIKIIKNLGLIIQLSPKIIGRIHLTELNNQWLKQPLQSYQLHQIISATIIEKIDDQLYDMTLKKKKQEQSFDSFKENQLVYGYIKSCSAKGCFIYLTRKIIARVLLKDLNDQYIKDISAIYYPGKLVYGRIIKINHMNQFISLSLKQSIIDDNYQLSAMITFSSLKIHQIIKGTITNIVDYGIFITINNSDHLSGLCHISQIVDHDIRLTIDQIKNYYQIGDQVQAVIIKLNAEKKE